MTTTEAPQTFWQQHWRWLIPLLLLGMAFMFTVTCGSFIWSMWRLKQSQPAYELVVQAVSNDERVIAALGEPIVFDEMITGDVQSDNDTGYANLQFGIAGPNGEAYVQSKAVYAQETWTLKELTIRIKEGDTLDWSLK